MKTLKHLALAALAVGALLALPAAASASGGFAVDAYPATVHASTGAFTLTGSSWSTECTAPVLDGTLATPSHTLSLASSENGACSGGHSVKMNGCQFILHPGSGTADIGSAGCGPIEVGVGACVARIGSQTGLTAKYSGLEWAKGIEIAEGLEISGTATVSMLGSCSDKTASLKANWKLATTDEAKKDTNLYALESYVPIGLGLTEEKHPRTRAQYFPASVAAHRFADKKAGLVASLGGFAMSMECATVNLGAGELTKEAETAFSLTGTYNGTKAEPAAAKCESAIGKVAVSMNSCHYELPEFERVGTSTTYAGKGASIACSKEGDSISVVGALKCTVNVPPQSLEVSLQNQGLLTGSMIPVTLSSAHLKYTTTSGCWVLGIKESGEDGVMNQELALQGTLAG